MDGTYEDWFNDITSSQVWELHDYASPLVASQLHETQSQTSTPSTHPSQVSRVPNHAHSFAASPAPVRTRKRNGTVRPQLRLLRLEEWDQGKSYDEDPPTCLHYSIEWAVTLNGQEILRDTEPDLVLNPAAYWQLCLRRRVEGLVQQKLGATDSNKPDHIVVVVANSGRSGRKLVKRFETDINWQPVEHHLTQWSDLFQSGKKLWVDVTFHHVQSGPQAFSLSCSNGRKQVASSATQRMRTRRSNQVTAETESTGNPDTWSRVYRILRCQDSCPKGPHCLVDQNSGRHMKLFPHYLEDIINRIDHQKMKFEGPEDVPDDIRRQVFAEDQQRRDVSQSKTAKSSVGTTPITINNHFPDHTQLSSISTAAGESTSPSNVPRAASTTETLDIPSPLDGAVREYSEWQKSRVSDLSYKEDIDRARDVVLGQRRDLKEIYNDQDPGFLVQEGVCIGTATRFVRGISTWGKRRRCEL